MLFDIDRVITETPFNISIAFVPLVQSLKNTALKEVLVNEDIKEKSVSIVTENKTLTSQRYHLVNISGYLEGRDMFMGKIPAIFSMPDHLISHGESGDGESRNDKKNELSSKYVAAASIILGSCTEKEMVWRLWLTATLQDKHQLTNNEITQSFYIDFTGYRS